MIVKILAAGSSDFHGVQYNDKKVEKGTGELMLMKNFPSFINGESSQQEVRNYLKSVSKNEKVKKPQFHAVISTRFRQHSREELGKVAEHFMEEMDYGKQPYIVVFHNDTENNHIHIVSTRVDKSSGKKINDSFERPKAQKALANTLEKIYGKSHGAEIEKLLGYRFGSLKQLELLFERTGFRMVQNKNDGNTFDILKNGVSEKTISAHQIVFEDKKDEARVRQLRAILEKYRNIYSNTVFKVEDRRKQEAMLPEEKWRDDWKPKIEFESEFQKKLRDIFGIDIVFHHKDDKMPFGYSLIDHKSGTVHKGGDIMKMGELFRFSEEKIDKRIFESLKDYNLPDENSKQILIQFLKRQGLENILPFMLFESKKTKNRDTYQTIRNDARNYLKSQQQKDIHLIKAEDGKFYAVHTKEHFIGTLEGLVGEKAYQDFMGNRIPTETISRTGKEDPSKELEKSVDELLFQLKKSSGGSKDPAESDLKKRRKKKGR